jgi:alkyl hydroperoxide reductase subunit D
MKERLESYFEALGDLGPAGRDLKLNLAKAFESSSLGEQDAALATAALAAAAGDRRLQALAEERLRELDFSQEQIQEARTSAALVGMLNMYYRFKHLLSHTDPTAMERYKNAGLRMTALAKPALGKARYEMLAFAVSVLNGCEMCLVAHEKTLKAEGVSDEKIHDLARLAATVFGVSRLQAASTAP